MVNGHIISIPFTTQKVNIYFLGDLHLGARDVDTKRLERVVSTIENDKNAYWFGLGDYADFIRMGDPRFDIRLLDEQNIKNFQEDITFIGDWYVSLVKKYLEPIKDKCLLLILGNHETVFMKYTGYNISEKLKEVFNVPVSQYESLVRLRFVDGQRTRTFVTFYLNHGWGGGRTSGSKINRVEEFSKIYEADIYVMGHVHGVGGSKGSIYRLTAGGNVEKREVSFITIGGFKTGKDSKTTYEMKEGYPDRTGIAWIGLWPKRMGNGNERYDVELVLK